MNNKIVIYFFHGRNTPDQELEDWGSTGPAFIIEHLHVTYMSTMWLQFDKVNYAIDLAQLLYGELIYYDGVFYGDWTITGIDRLPEGYEIEKFDIWKIMPKSIPVHEKRDKVISLVMHQLKHEWDKLNFIDTISVPLRLHPEDVELSRLLDCLLGYHSYCQDTETPKFYIDAIHDLRGFLKNETDFVPRTGNYEEYFMQPKIYKDGKKIHN